MIVLKVILKHILNLDICVLVSVDICNGCLYFMLLGSICIT